MAKSSAAIIGYETASPSSYSDEKELCHTTNGGGHGSLSKAKEGPGRRELMIFWRCVSCFNLPWLLHENGEDQLTPRAVPVR